MSTPNLIWKSDHPAIIIYALSSGTENCYTVPSEVLTLGHTHHFTVSSSVGDITGEPSPSTCIRN